MGFVVWWVCLLNLVFKEDETYMTFDPIAYINEPRWQASRLGLERIRVLLERLGRPQDRLKFVHVAGTNGKGSTCACLASILQAAGYRTGLFTSPYIETFEERIQVNGSCISLDSLTRITLKVKQQADALFQDTGDHPTEFELMTAVALEYFAQCECQIVVLEVGLGGRLDSTNVIDAPEVAVITRIGLDHTNLLGSSIDLVAAEKTGIIKMGSPVVSWPQDEDAGKVVAGAAHAQGCVLISPDFTQLAIGTVEENNGVLKRTFSYRGKNYITRLLGLYQPANIALAIEVACTLRSRGWEISQDDIFAGITAVQWPGRFELLPSKKGCPLFLVDGGHNLQGADALAESLQDVFPNKKPVLIIGILEDKDYKCMLKAVLPCAAGVVAVTPPNPRALASSRLVQAVCDIAQQENADNLSKDDGKAALPVCEALGFDNAIAQACNLAGENGLVCAFGSLYSIADIKAAWRASTC